MKGYFSLLATSSDRLSYFRVALIGEIGSEKNNVRRAYVQLLSNQNNDLEAQKASKDSVFERIDVLDSNVVTVQGIQIELITAERIQDFERIPTMIRCSHLDAIIIFYHIGSLRQFESIHQKWVPTVRRLYRDTPFIICATGIEARLPRDVRQMMLRRQLGDVEVGYLVCYMNFDNSVLFWNYLDTTTRSPYVPRSQLKKLILSLYTLLKEFENKSDLKYHRAVNKDPRLYQALITTKVGQSLSTELRASSYCEVSTKTYEGIEDLFNDVLSAIIASQQSKIFLTRNRVGRPRPKDACTLII
uniref:Ras family protein n=1 Tax=Thelazia callipaeda TaxID=103827 RepID=A0A0N5CJV6_THECL